MDLYRVPDVVLTEMGESVDSPWATNVDIEDLSLADFDRRTTASRFSDSTGEVLGMLSALADHYGLDNDSQTLDRVLRMYLSHVIDENDLDLRSEYDVTTLIPPRGWEPARPEIEYTPEEGSLSYRTAPTVAEMVDDVLERDLVDADNRSDFLKLAVRWLVEGE